MGIPNVAHPYAASSPDPLRELNPGSSWIPFPELSANLSIIYRLLSPTFCTHIRHISRVCVALLDFRPYITPIKHAMGALQCGLQLIKRVQ